MHRNEVVFICIDAEVGIRTQALREEKQVSSLPRIDSAANYFRWISPLCHLGTLA